MADFNVVVEQYRNQFNSIYEEIQNRVHELPNDVRKLKKKISNIYATTRNWFHMTIINTKIHTNDTSPIGVNDNLFRCLMEIYMWISLCLLISSLSFLLGQGACYWIPFMVFDNFVALFLSLFVLPYFTYYYLRKTVMVEEEGRVVVLICAMISSFLVGFVMKYRKLEFFPPSAFVSPLSVGLTAAFSPSALQNKARFAYIFTSSGSSFVWYAAFGFIIGSLNFAYLVWAIVYCALSAVDLQLKLGAIWTNGTGTYSNQIITIVFYIVSGFLMTTIFSSSEN